MSIHKYVLISLVLTICLMSSAFAQTTPAGTVTRTFNFAPVGLAATETAQINVVNRAATSSGGTAASCTGNISFFNSGGTAIGTATPFTVSTGQISSASLPFTKVGATTTRVEIRGQIQLTLSTTAQTPCSLEYSLETYDTTTGVTHLYQSNAPGLTAGGPFGR